MPEPKNTKRGPGRPRKGLVKVTLSLHPEQVAVLRMYALGRTAFAASGPVRPDLSEAVRAFLSEPDVSAVLRRAFEAYRGKIDELDRQYDWHGDEQQPSQQLSVRLLSGVLDRSFDVLSGFPLDEIEQTRRAEGGKKAPRKPGRGKR